MHALLIAATMFVSIIIHPGDTLSGLAAQYHTSVHELASVNGIENPDFIYAGAMLHVPTHSQQSRPTSTSFSHTALPVADKLPCHSTFSWPATVSRWLVPSGCYGDIFLVNRGDCFGWVRYLQPQADFWHRVSGPFDGQVVHFPPGRDGASDQGHWAYIVSVHGLWMLISEENMYWRGGGYNKMNYRFIPITADLLYYA